MSKIEQLTIDDKDLLFHAKLVQEGKRTFENAFQGVRRMIHEAGLQKVSVAGKTTYDFNIFRTGKKPIIGMYEEINSFVSFVKNSAEGGSSQEMAFVLVGEPGNGKTFFIEFLCKLYRQFLQQPSNQKFTFKFVGLDKIGGYGKINEAESQTYEDPMILLMNLFDKQKENEGFLERLGFSDKTITQLYQNYRPLGACTQHILNSVKNHTGNDLSVMLRDFIKVIPVSVSGSLGTLTGKYSAKDKITSSAVDLLGEESIQRVFHLADTTNPYRFDLRRGALARVAGGGVHFSDEIFKNKTDLVQVYLGVIQNRDIEIDGFKWPIDTLIVATSNNDEFNRFIAEKKEGPIYDRCRVCYMSHNMDYKLQSKLTAYALGDGQQTTISGESLHEDPNLKYAADIAFVLTRLPRSQKLTPIETMKLTAGEIAGEKSIKTLVEVIDELNRNQDVTKRWGQKGLGQRSLGRAIQLLIESSETNEGQCMFAGDIFKAIERVILDYVLEASDREKFLADLKIAKQSYREHVTTAMANAYMDDPDSTRRGVMSYVNMIVGGCDPENLGPDEMLRYRDSQSGELTALKIDERFITSVEERMELNTKERQNSYRTSIIKSYGQKMLVDPNYDFMDNIELVKAVNSVRLNSDIAGAGSLIGALANRTNEENQNLYIRILETMRKKLGYCKTCAEKTIEYFCTKEDES